MLLNIEFAHAEQCNATLTPCGGGCTATDMSDMFQGVTNFENTIGDISGWDVSCVTDMSGMFANSDFNGDISSWNTASVTDMSYMFANSDFDGDVASWDTSSVVDMSGMFKDSSFNQAVGGWDVSHVTDMSDMFSGTTFDQDVSSWDTSSVVDMSGMFKDSSFNQDISSWNTASVTDMSFMFSGSVFNQDVSSWNTASVIDMSDMFSGSVFNGDISQWDVSSVVDMSSIFENSQFTGDISSWNTASVTDMSFMFSGSVFNGDISQWDTSSVTDMSSMFENSPFNNDISLWNTASVNDMSFMFSGSVFDQDISQWNIGSVVDMSSMFHEGSLSTSNYDLLLRSWSSSPQQGVVFDAGSSVYSLYGLAGRHALEDTYGWTIIDGGIDRTDICSEHLRPCMTPVECTATDMYQMFYTTASNPPDFDSVYGDITGWNTSCITGMGMMFAGQENFNQDISGWDTSSVTTMWRMFGGAKAFNQPIGSWDTSSVTDMNLMFHYAESFDQPLGSWDISQVTNTESMFYRTGLSTENYDNLLNGWVNTAPDNLELDVGSTMYSKDALDARNTLVNEKGWTITDGGYICVESWIQWNSSCNGTGYTINYNDENNCGTNNNLPSNNGEIVSCTIPVQIASGLACRENWQCEEWLSCSSPGITTRTCSDKNNCGTEFNKPRLSKECIFSDNFEKLKKDVSSLISSKKKSALFDIVLEIVSEPKVSSDGLTIKVSLINFGSSDTVDANLEYAIYDVEGTAVKEFTKTVPVKTQVEYLENIDTTDLANGRYVLNMKLTYAGQVDSASAEKVFYIGNSALINLYRKLDATTYILFTLLIALLTSRFFYRRSRAQSPRIDPDSNFLTSSYVTSDQLQTVRKLWNFGKKTESKKPEKKPSKASGAKTKHSGK